MIETELNHCQIVSESLAGRRAMDEQALAALAVLTDRLARLKKANPSFAGVTLSPHAEAMADRAGALAVG